uniref:Uncharacterized protein n=1 Tax=Lepeophtheirus salmonis TaxID=72036 RepID=A0A0K2TR83_LEPSM
MTLERDRPISILTLYAVVHLQDKCLRRQDVRNVEEKEGVYHGGQTGPKGVTENSTGQSLKPFLTETMK